LSKSEPPNSVTASNPTIHPVVEFRQRDICSLACMSVLARAGITARTRQPGQSESGLVFVSRDVLRALGLDQFQLGHHIRGVTSWLLTEDDGVAQPSQPLRGIVVARDHFACALEALAVLPEDAGIEMDADVVVFSAIAIPSTSRTLSSGPPTPPAVLESLTLTWVTPGAVGETTWLRFTGETLADVGASASLLRTANHLSLNVSAPMQALIEQSIVLTDVVARFMAHPLVCTELPAIAPVSAQVRLLRMDSGYALRAGRPISLRIGNANGQSDPVSLDPELTSAIRAARELAGAVETMDVTVARLSRVSRLSSAHSRSHPRI